MVRPAPSLKVAGKYELLEEIGRGGMGTVWRAYSESMGVECALKMLLPSPDGADARQRMRLFREARIVAKLRSPYVVTVHDVGEWEGGPFVAMELLDGQSLKQWLKEVGSLSAEITIELVRQVALGLDKAHSAGLVHRDLKPDNLFIVSKQPLLVKILDFGIAKHSGRVDDTDMRTATGVITGTPLYMSPEQANASKDTDFRSDLWSLAVICFECLTGEVPFDGDSVLQLILNIVSGPMPVPSAVRPSLPAAFDAFWMRACNRDPARRPTSALALAEGLRAALADQLRAPQSPSQPLPQAIPVAVQAREDVTTSKRLPGSPRAYLLVAIAVAVGLGVLWQYWLQESRREPSQNTLVQTAPLQPSAAGASPAHNAVPHAPPPAAVTATPAPPTAARASAGVIAVPPLTVPSVHDERAPRKPTSQRVRAATPERGSAGPAKQTEATERELLDKQLGF